MRRALYRFRQVLHALFPCLPPADLTLAASLLDDSLGRLFASMERRDQRHALAVMRRLQRDGVDDADLLVAALLHDCGKGRVALWLRVAYVFGPGLVERLGRDDGVGWRGAAYRLAYHAELGGSRAATAGASDRTARLISGRVEAAEQEMLRLLYAADDAS